MSKREMIEAITSTLHWHRPRPRHPMEAITVVRAAVAGSPALAQQRKDCEELVDAVLGRSASVSECDLSASTFGDLMREIEERPPRVVVSVDPTRVTRQADEYDEFLEACDRNGVKFHCCEAPLLIVITS